LTDQNNRSYNKFHKIDGYKCQKQKSKHNDSFCHHQQGADADPTFSWLSLP